MFASQTDSEAIAHLIDHLYEGDLFEAVRAAVARLRGSFAIAVLCRDEPHRLVGARDGMPLVVGVGAGENFLASDAIAPAGVTDRIAYRRTATWSTCSCTGTGSSTPPGSASSGRCSRYAHGASVELGPYRYYMQKEIFEQPRAVADTLQDVTAVMPELFGDTAWRVFDACDRVLLLACGGSYHAALTAKHWIESLAGVPAAVEIASEFATAKAWPTRARWWWRCRRAARRPTCWARWPRPRQGMAHTLAICNVPTSALVRECALQFITRAGVEIGVASTKAFTTQLVALFLLAPALAQQRGRLDEASEQEHRARCATCLTPCAVLALEPQIIDWSERLTRRENILFLGRGMHYPVAMEGALKMKEISYIHAEAHAAGELKHGRWRWSATPCWWWPSPPTTACWKSSRAICTKSERGGQLFVFADSDCGIAPSAGVEVLRMTEYYGPLAHPAHAADAVAGLPRALARGTDIDKPRNPAKSVTVE